jgi:lipopolysaccharide/colanic/teichoic acid biosynthesis glycosyltransferase
MTPTKLIYLIVDLLVLMCSFLLLVWLKPASRAVYLPLFIKPFLGFCCIWIVLSLIGNKYSIKSKTIGNAINSIFKTNLVILCLVLLVIYIFKQHQFSRVIVLGTIGVVTFFELCVTWLAHKLISAQEFDNSDVMSNYVKPKPQAEPEKFQDEASPCKNNALEALCSIYLARETELCKYISDAIRLDSIPLKRTVVLNTKTIYNIEHYLPRSQNLFINLHPINDVQRINKYLIQVNKNCAVGGYVVGLGETIAVRYQKIMKRYPPVLNVLFYAIDFVFKRIIPKIPVLKQCYFALTKGKNRSISKTEILGRLCYCGFRIVDTKVINNKLIFIAQKVSETIPESTPSYGPFIRLRRVGRGGEIIHVYKFRTMHPFAEYLQQYVYEQNQLKESGKFEDDFRITGWGKVIRKLWLDELPQLINWLQGDLSIVGVRALSLHYFSLYPKELQELRTQFKPGLVPPFYADMPQNFDEILESERRYLHHRKSGTLFTNARYFCRAFWNIVVKKARSG